LWRSDECLTEEVQFDIGCVSSSYVTTEGPSSNAPISLDNQVKREILKSTLIPAKEEYPNGNVVTDYLSKESERMNSNEISEDDFNVDQPLLWPSLRV